MAKSARSRGRVRGWARNFAGHRDGVALRLLDPILIAPGLLPHLRSRSRRSTLPGLKGQSFPTNAKVFFPSTRFFTVEEEMNFRLE